MAPEHALDAVRRAAGFRTVTEVAALAPGVLVLDPGSVLIGLGVSLGTGVVLYPGAVLETRDTGTIEVAAGVRVGPGPVTIVADGASVSVGADAELGPGGVTVSAVSADVVVGAGARLRGGAVVEGPAHLGPGAQVLGTVAARDVVLEGGGTFTEPDPDRRAAVLKGAGRVHGVRVAAGEVIAAGTVPHTVERQRKYHPAAPSLP
ncbi:MULTISPECIES: hypothetical protein [unclassified Curtobacterium]|uniref:hypothetical protein n=1 Tax=unclassified Curtobacterium TaxID=257496 RepID=UPI000F4B6488|nr:MULTISPECIES: hypothetical protein [unclassified Curtobacterium]ROP65986.1 hypothetical protein EDF55_0431 [Curtobacterium sp. ZW137]TCK60085.1 hypothetical protein EDF27_3182 [Curtobacterium sp. PhB136]